MKTLNSHMKKFKPPWQLTVAVIVVITVTVSLAAWQFERAAGKRALEDSAHSGLAAPPLTISVAEKLQPFRRAVAIGRYLPEKQILLDNRVDNRRSGYHVITPLILDDGLAVAVNRGWIESSKRRASPPLPQPPATGYITVHGVLIADEEDAFVLSSQLQEGEVWQKLRLSDYSAAYSLTLASLALLRTGHSATDKLLPVSLRIDFKSTRSTAYAWQWLTFALLAAVFYVILGRRKQ